MTYPVPGPYCAALENRTEPADGPFLTLPPDLVTEARALGARTKITASGLFDIVPIVTAPEELRGLPWLPDRPLMKKLLAEIAQQAGSMDILLNVNAPYSVLSQISSPQLPAWLLRHPDDVYTALSALTNGLSAYIHEALTHGVKVISLADPYAQKNLLGEKCHRAFAGEYQLQLLQSLAQSPARGIVHLCPFSFTALEEYGLLSASILTPADSDYAPALLSAANTAESIIFIGRQCLHTRRALHLYQMRLS
ncbi:MAG: uroporphyrinogen decarboxylase family protein [Clostridia bacterium]|jgi:uroporphyrinogen-III decarboxylase|nr:uroporphyrinogen decarboxylase family protein [Clostridia bacterium]